MSLFFSFFFVCEVCVHSALLFSDCCLPSSILFVLYLLGAVVLLPCFGNRMSLCWIVFVIVKCVCVCLALLVSNWRLPCFVDFDFCCAATLLQQVYFALLD